MEGCRLNRRIKYLIFAVICLIINTQAAPTFEEIKELLGQLKPVSSSLSTEEKDETLDTGISYGSIERTFQPTAAPTETQETPEADTSEDSLSAIDYDGFPLQKKYSLVNEAETPPINFTKMHEEAIELRKAQIKEAIRSKLRLETLPVADPSLLTKRYPHHIFMAEELQNDALPPVDNYHAKTHTLLRFPQQVPDVKVPEISQDVVLKTIFVPLPLTVSKETLKKATLFVYLATPMAAIGQKALVEVRTNRATKKTQLYQEYVALEHKPEGHWVRIDVTDECKAWLRNEWYNNLGLVATATWNGIDLINYSNNQSVNNDTMDRIPFIKMELNEHDPLLKKRSLDSLPLSCEPGDKEERCCRYNFVLDFTELGGEFDFIVSPKRYYANYCAGKCPTYHLPSLPITMGMRRQVNRCCTPSDMSSLMLVYLDNGHSIVQSELPKMSISSCGCE